ncbi:MAG: glycoside hydrolase family 3 C-terminal domain-containing protein, partial [Clostridia bacterium]|nr:glycoside hydrolase family 3 C-terminal domain-containing protein [Clostridia bacterium]
MLKWERVKYHPASGLGENGRYLTGSEKHLKVSGNAAQEGAVLLKNDGILPLNNGTKLALFGTGSVDYIKCGGGSGDVISKTSVSLYEGLKNREKEKKVAIFEELAGFYMDKVKNGCYCEPVCPDTIFSRAKEFTDTAVIVIKRYSYESGDIAAEKGGYYLTDEEIALIDRVTNSFENVIVVLNIGSIIDLSYIANNPKIKAVLLGYQAGSMGGEAWSKILVGDINPSGKLVDTIPMDYKDFPSAENFLESEEYVEYTEDIYVGYRYFETFAPEKVLYPFGYGLSYTDFDITVVDAKTEEDVITFRIKVKNTGKTAGKEVVQMYLSAPGEVLGRPKFELCGFKKTAMLNPEEEEVVKINFDLKDFASFDDTGKIEKSSYILEKGEYTFYIGNSIRNTSKADFSIILDENRVVKTVKPCLAPEKLTKRLNSRGEYEEFVCENEEIAPVYNEIGGEMHGDKILLTDVLDGKAKIEDFVQQLYF